MYVHYALLSFALVSVPAIAQREPDPFTRTDRPLRASTVHGDRVVAGRAMILDVATKRAKYPKAGALVVFDPATGLCLFEVNPFPGSSGGKGTFLADEGPGSRMYAAGDRLVRFATVDTSLTIKVSDVRARDLDDAEAKLLQLFGEHEHELAAWAWRSEKRVALSALPLPALERDFFLPQFSSGPYAPTRIVSVSRPDGAWELILENQWKAKVVLNDKFEIVGTTRVE